jgi:transcription antitermination factor NusG
LKPANLGQAFLNREPTLGVRFAHNDYVRIVSGAYAGQSGSLVTVLSLEPQPQYIVELENGFDAEILQSEIEYANS